MIRVNGCYRGEVGFNLNDRSQSTMKEYEIKGRLPAEKLCSDPIVRAIFKGKSFQEAGAKFNKKFPNTPIIGWVVTKLFI